VSLSTVDCFDGFALPFWERLFALFLPFFLFFSLSTFFYSFIDLKKAL